MGGAESDRKLIASNRKARFNYEILDTFEAGIALLGPEVKSLRAGNANLGDAYAIVRRGEVFLVNAHIGPYDQAGRANILAKLRDFGIDMDVKDPRIGRILDRVKEQEFKGFSYDGADASFELLARDILGQLPHYFKVERFNVSSERRYDARGNLKTVAEAIVTVNVDGERISSVGEGNGPVDALNAALRKDLGRFSDYLSDIELADYKVRIFGSGTDAETRVLIESKDASGARWTTVGVSPNIVDASFQALMDSITFKLFHDKAKPAASQKSENRNQKLEA